MPKKKSPPKMDDLFSRLNSKRAEDKSPTHFPDDGKNAPRKAASTAAPAATSQLAVELPGLEDPRVQRMVAEAFLSFYSVDEWVASKVAPVTFEFDTPRGKLWLTKSKAAYRRLVEAEQVVFSPLEAERFIKLRQRSLGVLADLLEQGLDEEEAAGQLPLTEALVDNIYRAKATFPGAKMDEVRLAQRSES